MYGDLGGVLLVAADGDLYCRDNNTMEVRPEPDPGWWMAWAAAAEEATELRALLPPRPPGTPDCRACDGAGRIQATPSVSASRPLGRYSTRLRVCSRPRGLF